MDKHSDLLISQTDARPMYLQIMEQIRNKVALGDWPAGSDIPSIRLLAAQLCVSVITVKRAYQELEREGVIVTHQGRGSSVSASPNLSLRLCEQDMHDHLEEAARLALQLGLSPDQAAARFLAIFNPSGNS
jgi:GntR family transcriptional regulator